MNRLLLFFLLQFPLISFSQKFFLTDDVYSFSNPASKNEQKVFSKILTYNNFRNPSMFEFGSVGQVKFNLRGFNLGVLMDYNNNSFWQEGKAGGQLGYNFKINRRFSFSTALALNLFSNNIHFSNTLTTWNPVHYGLDGGIQLASRNWIIGVNGINIKSGIQIIDTIQSQPSSAIGVYVSYRFKLDSMWRYSLRPALFIQRSSNGFNTVNVDVKLQIKKHAISLGAENRAVFVAYEYSWTRWSLGYALRLQNSSLLSNKFDAFGMNLRAMYNLKRRSCKFIGTPSF